MYDITELNGKKVDELKSLAKELSIPGFNKLKKEDMKFLSNYKQKDKKHKG